MPSNEISRLEHVVQAQQEALGHWRRQADLDYVQIQRMYYALLTARDCIENAGVRKTSSALLTIDEALSGVRMIPPKEFQ